MATKDEISDKLNAILDIDVEFTKLKKEDLEKLLTLLGDPKMLIQLGFKGVRSKAKKEWLERPLKELLDTGLEEMLGDEGNGGPLGFGILPRVLKRREELAKKHEKE